MVREHGITKELKQFLTLTYNERELDMPSLRHQGPLHYGAACIESVYRKCKNSEASLFLMLDSLQIESTSSSSSKGGI